MERVVDPDLAEAAAPAPRDVEDVAFGGGDDRGAVVFEQPGDDEAGGLSGAGGGDQRDVGFGVGAQLAAVERAEAEPAAGSAAAGEVAQVAWPGPRAGP